MEDSMPPTQEKENEEKWRDITTNRVQGYLYWDGLMRYFGWVLPGKNRYIWDGVGSGCSRSIHTIINRLTHKGWFSPFPRFGESYSTLRLVDVIKHSSVDMFARACAYKLYTKICKNTRTHTQAHTVDMHIFFTHTHSVPHTFCVFLFLTRGGGKQKRASRCVK